METPRSAFSGVHVTHTRQRPDAVIHQGRDFVPTVWGTGDENKDTQYVSTIDQLREKGGNINFNEDHTEIWLTLPERHKFSTKMFGEQKTETIEK